MDRAKRARSHARLSAPRDCGATTRPSARRPSRWTFAIIWRTAAFRKRRRSDVARCLGEGSRTRRSDVIAVRASSETAGKTSRVVGDKGRARVRDRDVADGLVGHPCSGCAAADGGAVRSRTSAIRRRPPSIRSRTRNDYIFLLSGRPERLPVPPAKMRRSLTRAQSRLAIWTSVSHRANTSVNIRGHAGEAPCENDSRRYRLNAKRSLLRAIAPCLAPTRAVLTEPRVALAGRQLDGSSSLAFSASNGRRIARRT